MNLPITDLICSGTEATEQVKAGLTVVAMNLFNASAGELSDMKDPRIHSSGIFHGYVTQQKLDIAGGCTATSPYITSKKL